MTKIAVKYWEEVDEHEYLKTDSGYILARDTKYLQPPEIDMGLMDKLLPSFVHQYQYQHLMPPIMWNGNKAEIKKLNGKTYAITEI